MRTLSPLLASLLFTGCAVENELRYNATLEARTSGVVITDDGLTAWASMEGTTCAIDPRWGCPTIDVDLPTDGEQIVDHHAGRTLGRSAVGVHTLSGSAWDAADDLVLTDVRVAKLADAGRLVLAGDRGACALHRDGGASIAVPGELCGDDARADIDRRTGHLFVATAGALLRVGADGATVLADAGVDRVARDASLARTYVGSAGQRSVRAITDDGASAWTASLTGSLRGVATRGDKGELLAFTARDDGFGELVRIDGATGAVQATYSLPEGDGEIAVGGDGTAVAVIRDRQVHWYTLQPRGESITIDPSPANCMTDWGISRD